jgi:hypothetical protein
VHINQSPNNQAQPIWPYLAKKSIGHKNIFDWTAGRNEAGLSATSTPHFPLQQF